MARRIKGLTLAALVMGTLSASEARADLVVSLGGTATQVFRYADNLAPTGFTALVAPVQDVGLASSGIAYALYGTVGGAGTVVSVGGGSVAVPLAGTLQAGARLAVGSGGNFAVTTGGSNQVNLYNAAGVLTGFNTYAGPVQDLAYDAFGNLGVLLGAPGSLGTVALGTGVSITTGQALGTGARLAIAPGGNFSLALGGDARVFNYAANGSLLGFNTFTAPVLDLAYDRFGNLTTLTGTIGGAGTVFNALGSATTGTLGAGASVAAQPAAVPEPASLLLAGIGAAGVALGAARRRR